MLVAILCRFCRCLAGRPPEREPSAKPAGEAVGEGRRLAALERAGVIPCDTFWPRPWRRWRRRRGRKGVSQALRA